MTDFEVFDNGSVWTIKAVSDSAKQFAEENFEVEPWQGVSIHFSTDWRVARDLVRQLVDEGFKVG